MAAQIEVGSPYSSLAQDTITPVIEELNLKLSDALKERDSATEKVDGLNEKARDKVNDCSMIHEDVGRSFLGFPAPRNGARPTRNRENRNTKDIVISCEQFFSSLENIFTNDLIHSFNRIRIILNKIKKHSVCFSLREQPRSHLWS